MQQAIVKKLQKQIMEKAVFLPSVETYKVFTFKAVMVTKTGVKP